MKLALRTFVPLMTVACAGGQLGDQNSVGSGEVFTGILEARAEGVLFRSRGDHKRFIQQQYAQNCFSLVFNIESETFHDLNGRDVVVTGVRHYVADLPMSKGPLFRAPLLNSKPVQNYCDQDFVIEVISVHPK